MKVGDLVRFTHPKFQESYGVGIVVEYVSERAHSLNYTGRLEGHRVYFKDEIIHARKEELEVISESR